MTTYEEVSTGALPVLALLIETRSDLGEGRIHDLEERVVEENELAQVMRRSDS